MSGERRIVGGTKDENGIFTKTPAPAKLEEIPPPPPALDPDLSMDSMLYRGLMTIDRIMLACAKEASTGAPSRESVMNLKDCIAMIHVLQEKEAEILDKMTNEQIEEFLRK